MAVRGRPFQKGQSGNPGGRPKDSFELIEMRALAKDLSKRAVERLGQMLDHDDGRVVVAAAKEILDRAYGKPTQVIEGSLDLGVKRTTLADVVTGIAQRLAEAEKPDAGA